MLRSILIGLDGSEHSDSAFELGLRWARHRDALSALEGLEGFDGVQRFLDAVRKLAGDRRLSRFMYLSSRT